jgi:hypothetical protein
MKYVCLQRSDKVSLRLCQIALSLVYFVGWGSALCKSAVALASHLGAVIQR